MANRVVCVDASFAAKWLIPEPDQPEALARLRQWQARRVTLVGPPHLFSEITAVISAAAYRGALTAVSARSALVLFARFEIELRTYPDLYNDALELTLTVGTRRSYDAEYIALAHHLGCELWTADLRLARAFERRFDWIRTLEP